jgi:mRNA interferase RelE/StbE
LAWTIKYSATSRKQLKKLDKQEAKRILDYLEFEVLPKEKPRDLGKPLTGSLKGLWRYRVGDHRVVCEIHDEILVVIVVMLGHRREVYR